MWWFKRAKQRAMQQATLPQGLQVVNPNVNAQQAAAAACYPSEETTIDNHSRSATADPTETEVKLNAN